MRNGIDYCVAPESLRLWFSAFTDLAPLDRVWHIGETLPLVATLEQGIGFRDGERQHVVIYSSHESLMRDVDLSERLRARGLSVASQTPEAAALGIDKVALKKVLHRTGVATPKWGDPRTLDGAQLGVLLKRRNVTQSHGIHWYEGVAPRCSSEWYWEDYVPGCEYSVVAFVDLAGTTLFPIIWKGDTRKDLLPPWQRPRICPDPRLSEALESRLLSAATAVLNSVRCWGFVELEFIVDRTGNVQLIEINPRVCGTMRLAAMACDTKIFSLPACPANRPKFLAPTRYAIELPYDGVPFVSDDVRVVASSRITFAAETTAELLVLVSKHLSGRKVPTHLSDLLNV